MWTKVANNKKKNSNKSGLQQYKQWDPSARKPWISNFACINQKLISKYNNLWTEEHPTHTASFDLIVKWKEAMWVGS